MGECGLGYRQWWGSCERSNEPLVSIKSWEYLEWLKLLGSEEGLSSMKFEEL
jgi:hypothetical protein